MEKKNPWVGGGSGDFYFVLFIFISQHDQSKSGIMCLAFNSEYFGWPSTPPYYGPRTLFNLISADKPLRNMMLLLEMECTVTSLQELDDLSCLQNLF